MLPNFFHTQHLTIIHPIGIAPNKYLAKVTSNLIEPDGLSVINPIDLPDKLYFLNLKSLPGIGSKTQNRLIKNGISSVKQLCSLDRSILKTVWSNFWGEKVWYLIRGADLPLEETKKVQLGIAEFLRRRIRTFNRLEMF